MTKNELAQVESLVRVLTSQPITLRDRMAIAVVAEMHRNARGGTKYSEIAKNAYSLADAMLKARNT